MISGSDAAKIVKDCIRLVGGFNGDMALDDQLQTVGIESANSQQSLKIEIATNPNLGVASKNHTMSTGDFTFSEASTVADVRQQVVDNAEPAEEKP